MAAKAKLCAALRELKLLRSGVGIVTGDAVAVLDGPMNAPFGELRLLLCVALVTEIGSLCAQQLRELRCMRIVTAITGAHFHRRVNACLREFFLELDVALVAELGSLSLERYGCAGIACGDEHKYSRSVRGQENERNP